jgi:hypothetical protein
VKIRVVPVAAGLAITGASLANAEATATPSSSAPGYGQTAPGLAPQGGEEDGDPGAAPRQGQQRVQVDKDCAVTNVQEGGRRAGRGPSDDQAASPEGSATTGS